MGSGAVKGRIQGAHGMLRAGDGSSGQSLKHRQEAAAQRRGWAGGHYTKASRLDEPLTLRYSLLSSLCCCSCLSSWRR